MSVEPIPYCTHCVSPAHPRTRVLLAVERSTRGVEIPKVMIA